MVWSTRVIYGFNLPWDSTYSGLLTAFSLASLHLWPGPLLPGALVYLTVTLPETQSVYVVHLEMWCWLGGAAPRQQFQVPLLASLTDKLP